MSHHRLVFPIRTLTLAGLLVGGLLAPPALAHSDGALHPTLDATTPARPANSASSTEVSSAAQISGPSVDLPVVSAGLTAAAREAAYVDPAGGHPRIRPIETQNPYRARPSRR